MINQNNMTALEKIILEIENELQTLEILHGKEIFGRKVGLAFAKRVAEQAKEMEKDQREKLWTNEEVFDMLYKTDKFLMIELREYWKTIER